MENLVSPSGRDWAALAARAADDLRGRLGTDRFDVAVILGSGWKDAAEGLGKTIGCVPASEVAGFPGGAVAGHDPQLRAVRIAGSGKVVLLLGSRTHYYESRDSQQVAHAVRTAAALGVRQLILTNGAGSLNPQWGPGQPVLLRDQINLTAATPLSGPRFVDLTDLYSERLRRLARKVDPQLPEGVYVQFPGPQYETPAEIGMVRAFGGDLVGMSTALEAIAARAEGMEILGLSLVTNLAAGIGNAPLSHQEVLTAGKQAGPKLAALLSGILERM